MAMKGHFAFVKLQDFWSPTFREFSVISRTLDVVVVVLIPQQKCSRSILQPQLTVLVRFFSSDLLRRWIILGVRISRRYRYEIDSIGKEIFLGKKKNTISFSEFFSININSSFFGIGLSKKNREIFRLIWDKYGETSFRKRYLQIGEIWVSLYEPELKK